MYKIRLDDTILQPFSIFNRIWHKLYLEITSVEIAVCCSYHGHI